MSAREIVAVVLILLGIAVPIATWFFVDSWLWWGLIAAGGGIAVIIGAGVLLAPLLKYAALVAV
jgi:hypothetical protein